MEIQDLGAIGEFVSALAVVMTLAYLSVQVRDQNRESRIRTVQDLIHSWNERLRSSIEVPDVTDIFARGSVSYINLELKDQPRFAAILGRMTRIFEGLYIQNIEGRIDCDLWVGIENSIVDLYSQPGCKELWATRSHWYSTKFVKFLSEQIDKEHVAELIPTGNLA